MQPTLTHVAPQPQTWDAFVRAHPRGHFLQLWGWGDLKAAFGWRVERVALAEPGGGLAAVAQVLLRPFPLRVGSMAYLPFGPLATTQAATDAIHAAVDSLVREQGAAFLRWEPGLPPLAADPAAHGFHESAETVQPPRTILLDLRDDEDALLARMNQGTRRKIRAGAKKGVTYRHATREDLPRFDTLMQATGERNAFGVHAGAYYTAMFDLFVPDGDAALLLAEHEGDLLAAVFVFAVGGTGVYLAGASSDAKRNLMASYGVQWAAIQWAQAQGCHTYDLWGIPDHDAATLEADFQARGDGLWGVYGFKRGWGGTVTRSAGAWDRVYNPALVALYRAARRFR